ncbi:MAG: TIGR03668 family PPOX class F420-dependent oxidoreductase [Conexibacteraceae bacterium]|nr:TIGR03668 family PPOX class F420-dependent oxidoreductase [Conexibacteraceae bacterium]
MDAAQARARFVTATVARLATVGSTGRPHLVPVTFALLDDVTLVTAVDHKPKRTTALQRLANIAAEPRVSVLVDHYEDDWEKLWWARADGLARVQGGRTSKSAALVEALCARYAQYRVRPPGGPFIVIEVQRFSGWSAAYSAASD